MASRCRIRGCTGSRKGEGRTLVGLIMWNTSQLPLVSKVAAWQSPALSALVSLLPQKVRHSPPGGGLTAALHYNALACFRFVLQSHWVIDCCCHCGLVIMLCKTSIQKDSDLIAIAIQHSMFFKCVCELELCIDCTFPPFLRQPPKCTLC